MKTLYLLRHAKSSWKDDKLADEQRPLKKRGTVQAEALSNHLTSLLPAPQIVLCSPTVRTQQTLTYFQQAWALKASAVHCVDSLYLAERDTLFSLAQGLPDTQELALMVGHNPGLTDFALSLLCAESEELKTLKTCTFLQFDFEVDSWQQVTPHTGKLKLNVHPKSLGI